jgi:hypothetical protein
VHKHPILEIPRTSHFIKAPNHINSARLDVVVLIYNILCNYVGIIDLSIPKNPTRSAIWVNGLPKSPPDAAKRSTISPFIPPITAERRIIVATAVPYGKGT